MAIYRGQKFSWSNANAWKAKLLVFCCVLIFLLLSTDIFMLASYNVIWLCLSTTDIRILPNSASHPFMRVSVYHHNDTCWPFWISFFLCIILFSFIGTRSRWYMSLSKERTVEILTAKNGIHPRHPDGAFIVRPSQNQPGEMSLSVK